MAPDAIASIVDSRSAAVGGLENTYQTVGLPLPAQIRPSTIPIVAPLQTRIKPQKRRAKLPSIVYRESDSSLSEYEDFDSDAETECMHNSPKKQRSSMVVQHPSATTITTASTVVLEIPLEDLSRHIDMSTNDRPLYFPSKSTSKKRKRDENSPLNSLDPLTKKLIMISKSEKEAQSPLGKEAIETFGRNPENKDSALINSRASSPDNAFATGRHISHSQNEWDNADNGEVMTQISDDDVGDILDKLQSAAAEDIVNSTEVPDLAKDRQKLKAVEDLVEIEKIFAKLKDSIYNEKLHRVEIEMKLLREGSHPEYVAQKRVIDYRLEEKVRLSNAQYNHAMKSLDISTYVNRAQLHSQYFQQARKLREDTLYHCSELWYNIQRERRVGDAPVPEYTVRISDRQSTRIKQRMQYNWEVQILGGIQKQIGFPAAPDVDGATKEEMDEDFKSLGITSHTESVVRSIAPPNLLPSIVSDRTISHYRMPVHTQPLSPTIPTAAQQSLTYNHPRVHRHHHHHHRAHPHIPQPEPDHLSDVPHPPNLSAGNNFAPPASSEPLVPHLQHLSHADVKMEPIPLLTSPPTLKLTEAFSNFPTYLVQEQRPSPYSMVHQIRTSPHHQNSNSCLEEKLGTIRSIHSSGEKIRTGKNAVENLATKNSQAMESLGNNGGEIRGPNSSEHGGGAG